MIYLDTSYLAKLYLDESGAPAVVAWAEGRGDFVCAAHGRLELIATFKRKQREGALTSAQLSALARTLEEDEARDLVRWLPLDAALIREACTRLQKLPPAVFLRAADALHLACASDAGLKEIYSHDRHLLAAAPHFGLKGLDVISPKSK
ncbi:MAG: type II toxin-antitoxin system VapC family toxin [Opitutaceae bacterium]|nr:type II toxin-antitoxin system VapC family toxin [Opitutaceae bacterium]